MKHFFHALVSVFVLTLLITNITQADQLALPAADIVAPTVIQNNHVSTIEAGENHLIRVTVTDNIAIKSVILFYRGIGNSEYQVKTMHNVVGTDDYVVTVNADQISMNGLEYYIRATDSAGNTLLHGYAFSPVTVTINALAADTTLTAAEPDLKPEKETSYKWLWIGLGVLAVGAAVAGGGGGGGGGSDDNGTEQSTITISAPVPVP